MLAEVEVRGCVSKDRYCFWASVTIYAQLRLIVLLLFIF